MTFCRIILVIPLNLANLVFLSYILSSYVCLHTHAHMCTRAQRLAPLAYAPFLTPSQHTVGLGKPRPHRVQADFSWSPEIWG